MNDANTEAKATQRRRPKTTDLERRVVAHEQTSGAVPGPGPFEVTARHGIWTVTDGGAFVGDYHDQEAADAAAATALHPGPERQIGR
jgi:hypothetical protein